ncbi:MAG: ABC transporter ATP-binding protein [Trueperaceae bacterium]
MKDSVPTIDRRTVPTPGSAPRALRPAPEAPAVDVRDLSLAGRLDAVNLTVTSGALALIGANGAGKSTLLHVLVGRLAPQAGEARVFGHGPRSADAAALRAYVPQRISFPSHLRAIEVLAAAARLKGASTERALAAAERMGLRDVLGRSIGALSGGMTQRLALASALLDEPPLWLLDEPASALDGGGLARLADWSRAHVGAGGTVIVSAHRPEEVEAFADDACLMRAGAVVERLPVSSLFTYVLQRGGERPAPLPAGWQVRREATEPLREVLGDKRD